MLSEVDLKSLVENSLIMVKEKAMKNRINIEKDIDQIPDVVIADDRKFKQIMFNLISNAVKFTPDQGTISIKAGICDL